MTTQIPDTCMYDGRNWAVENLGDLFNWVPSNEALGFETVSPSTSNHSGRVDHFVVRQGRGAVDYKISRGCKDSTLVEFKLASNSKLKQNLANQVQIYEKSNHTKKSIKVILFFSETELNKVLKILKELNLKEGKTLVLIDADRNDKPSASNVRS